MQKILYFSGLPILANLLTGEVTVALGQGVSVVSS